MIDETAKRRNGETARKPIRHFRDLEVYQNALATGLRVYELSKKFPPEEKYSLTDQIRRCSRSVCANLAEAWRKRRYEAAFISKLSDAEGEAAETQVHLEFAYHHRYLSRDEFVSVDEIDEPKEMAYSPTRAQAMNLKQRLAECTKRSSARSSPFRRFALSPVRHSHSSLTPA
jgi:four helix bundle protein